MCSRATWNVILSEIDLGGDYAFNPTSCHPSSGQNDWQFADYITHIKPPLLSHVTAQRNPLRSCCLVVQMVKELLECSEAGWPFALGDSHHLFPSAPSVVKKSSQVCPAESLILSHLCGSFWNSIWDPTSSDSQSADLSGFHSHDSSVLYLCPTNKTVSIFLESSWLKGMWRYNRMLMLLFAFGEFCLSEQ